MVQGFCFALLQCSPYKRLQRFLYHSCSYTTHTVKQRTGLYRRFSCNLPHSTAANNRPTQADIILPAPRWSVSQRPNSAQIPDTTATPGRCTGQHIRPIIIRYIRVQGCAPVMDPCQTVQHITDHASPVGSRYLPRLALTWHRVSLALAWHCAFFLAQQRGTIVGYRRSSFRAFAR